MIDFIDIKKLKNEYRNNRLNDYLDVELRPSQAEITQQAKRCMGCGIPFCHAYGCPLTNNIAEMNHAVLEGRYLEAYNILTSTSPFPEFTSRVCPALCEASCCANIPSESVNIKKIEYFVIEKAFEMGYVKPIKNRISKGKRVAVIGSGPSGLASAFYLNRMGYEVVVFEKQAFAGGLLRYGIPDFKLPIDIIQRRIDILKESGIYFEYSVDIGKDISGGYLKKNFDAISLCIGSEVPRDLNIDGRNTQNIHFALDFLKSQNKVVSGENANLEISAKDKKVLIIGGGDTGSDCLGTSLRQGAKEVTQIEIMPEPPQERHSSTPWPEWEYKKRTSSSHLEGGTRLWNISSKEFISKDGAVKGLKAEKIKWDLDSNGRPQKFNSTNENFEIEADLVLLSMGFTGVIENSLIKDLNVELTDRKNIDCNKTKITAPSVFACGDCVSGPSLVVRAIAGAKQTVNDIDNYLK